MKFNYAALAVLAAVALAAAPVRSQDNSSSPSEPTAAQKAEVEKFEKLLASLHPVHGDVPIPGAAATLHLGENYYFLDAADAKRVLTEGWGNSPDATQGVLGMVFPKGMTFLDDTWGAVITYQSDGYVSDSDAKTADYDKLLTSMRQGEDDENKARKDKGFDPIHLVGWAQAPSYDPTHHAVIWARELQFGDLPNHTLNYDVRELGRRGVLSVNIVDKMSHLAAIRPAAEAIEQIATFDPGARYTDYQAGVDKKSAYGIAGLIAAGAGVVLAQKLGLIGIILLFLKKGAIIVIAAFSGALAWVRNFFTRKKK
jgi:uncharacterized membrane-anchored protein